MKLRLKIRGQSRQIDLGETSASNLTLGALKASVSETFLIDNSNVELSLNKRDILTGDDTTIADLGIVPGDLIHVIGSDEPENITAPQRPQLLVSHSQGSVVVDQLDTNQHNTNDDDHNPPSQNLMDNSGYAVTAAESRSSEEGMEVEGHGSDNFQRPMLEPLVIRESTANEVPALLQELYSSSDITCLNDALFVLLHVLMLESGFSLPGDADMARLPENWKRSGFYMCMYQYILTPGVACDCSLMAVSTGSSMAVHGLSKTVGSFKTDHLQLKAENFVRDTSQDSAAAAYRSLDRLSNMFKDTIGLALQNHLATSAGFRETQGLLSLPCEIKMRLMCFLDAKSVCNLGQTCQQWRFIYKDNTVWRRIYLSSFERPEDTSLSRNWYEMFKTRYEEWVEQQAARQRFFSHGLEEDFGIPAPFAPFGPPFPNPTRPFFPPRFLGGEHDLNPQFGGNLPNGRHQLRRPPNPFFNQGQGHIARGRGNLTGSPFFNNGGFF